MGWLKGRTLGGLVVLVVLAALAGSGYLWLIQKQPQEATRPLEKVTMGISATSLLPSLIHIAAAKGYFQEEGIDMEVKGYATGKHALLATLNGEIDMGTVAGPPIVFNSFERDDFAILATVVDSAEHAKGLARKDRDINVPQDLVGKKIATTIGTTAHFNMALFLIFSGVDASDVELVNLKPKALIKAITNGDVDAIFSWEPNILEAQENLGDNAVLLPNKMGYEATFNLVSLKGYIDNNPELLIRVLRSLRKAEEFVKDNRNESIDIVASSIASKSETIDKIWNGYNFTLSLNQTLLIILEDQARWSINAGLLDERIIPNYLDYINFDALEALSPEAVTVIH